MINSKYTSGGLPILSRETAQVFMRDLLQRLVEGNDSMNKQQDEITDRIRSENPLVVEIIKQYSIDNFETPIERATFMCGAITIYELLRIEAEKSRLEE